MMPEFHPDSGAAAVWQYAAQDRDAAVAGGIAARGGGFQIDREQTGDGEVYLEVGHIWAGAGFRPAQYAGSDRFLSGRRQRREKCSRHLPYGVICATCIAVGVVETEIPGNFWPPLPWSPPNKGGMKRKTYVLGW